jgi:siroheme synthase
VTGDAETGARGAGDVVAGGAVHLVGAGPGDPQLLTRRAARLLADADVVVTEGASTTEAAALAPASARRCHIGRTPEGPAWPVERVVALLTTHAQQGRQVVRLVSGEVFVGSRAAEELEALRARGVEVTTTPGVSAATAAPLASGTVPVPGTVVTIVAGDDEPLAAPVAWAPLVERGATIVVLGGHAQQRDMADALVAAGAARSTPVAQVQTGGAAGGAPVPAVGATGWRVVHSDLADLCSTGAPTTSVPSPGAIVIGPVRRAARLPG